MTKTEEYRATVTSVIQEGRRGPFAVTDCPQIDKSVTFSLDNIAWEEEEAPVVGMVVILSDVRKHRNGWRAMRARIERPPHQAVSSQ